MDCSSLCQALLSMQTAALPRHGIVHVSLHVGWAIVLAALALRINGVPWRLRRALGGLLAAWTLMPGSMSPAYWLGLAFQAPSLTLIVVAGISLYVTARRPPRHEGAAALHATATGVLEAGNNSSANDQAMGEPFRLAVTGRAIEITGLVGIVLGWLLLLDTFALLPFALYATGFSAAAVAVAALLVLLPWLVVGAREGGATVALAGVLVLTLFVVTRLPTGNLWDALLDPLLWLALQISWLGRLLKRT